MNTHYQPLIEVNGLRIYTDQHHIARVVLEQLAAAPFEPVNSGWVTVQSQQIRWERINPIEF